jgi:hypothetical protein
LSARLDVTLHASTSPLVLAKHKDRTSPIVLLGVVVERARTAT